VVNVEHAANEHEQQLVNAMKLWKHGEPEEQEEPEE
jgi:hypothetical protein